MLIKCPECQRDVSDSATACPGCGHPLVTAEPVVLKAPMASIRTPTMAGSFMLGGLGTLIRLAGFLALFLSLLGFIFHGPSAPIFLIVGVALIIGGSYAKYVSQHSVRTTK